MSKQKPFTESDQHLLALIPPVEEQGSEMRALPNDRWRLFVLSCMSQGVKVDHTLAAKEAGFTGNAGTLRVQAHRLAHDPRVQAALLEESRKKLQTYTGPAVALLGKMIGDETIEPKDRIKAATAILDRGGLGIVQTINVNRSLSREEKLLKVVELARMLGKNPRDLIGSLADSLPGDFSVLEEKGIENGNAPGIA